MSFCFDFNEIWTQEVSVMGHPVVEISPEIHPTLSISYIKSWLAYQLIINLNPNQMVIDLVPPISVPYLLS